MYDQPTDILPSVEPPEFETAQKPSPLTFAGLILGVLSILGICGATGIALITRNVGSQAASALASVGFLVGLCVFAAGPLGIGLNVFSILQKPQNRTLPMVGLALNAIAFLVMCVVVLLGVWAVNYR
ncbi:MAG: hypothetical protein AB1750_15640 [Chloroflexota bacterium]